jgi:hypothetical protein
MSKKSWSEIVLWEQTFVKKLLSAIQKFDKNRIKDSQKSSIQNSIKKFDKNILNFISKVWQKRYETKVCQK